MLGLYNILLSMRRNHVITYVHCYIQWVGNQLI